MTPPTIGALLVNWNTAGWTASCVDSLRAGTRVPDCIAVVDNGSTPADLQQLRALPGIDLLPQAENRGFSGANNIGLARLLQKSVDFIWILNNDTVVDPHCLARLSAALEQDAGVGAATGRIYYDEPRDQLWYAGGTFRPHTLTAKHRGATEQDCGQFSQAEDVAFLCGCCMLVRADVIRQLGGFHPAFFAYCEDAEWSLRAHAAGVRIRYEPTARLWHCISASLKKNTAAQPGGLYERLTFRNRLFIVRLHARRWQWPWATAAVLRCAAMRTLHAWRQGDSAVPAAIRAGLREGWTAPLAPATAANTVVPS